MAEATLIDLDAKKQEEPEVDERDDDAPEPKKVEVEKADSGEAIVRPTRKERRAERGYRHRLEEATKAKDEEIAKIRREMDMMRGAMAQLSQSSRQAPEASAPSGHPLKPVMKRIWDQQVSLQERMNSAKSMEEAQKLREQWEDLELEKDEIRRRYVMQGIPKSEAPVDVGVHVEERLLRGEFPQVFENQNALQYAATRFQTMKVDPRRDRSMSLMDLQKQALREAADAYGIAMPKERPSDGMKARFGSVSAQAGSRYAAGEVRLSEAQQRMARATYPNDDDHTAFAKWASLWQKNQSE